jgi:O-antigen biosynthesis protein
LLHSDVEMDLLREDADRARLRLLRWIGGVEPPVRGFAERSGICFVGGFAHRPNVDGMLWFVREIMPLLLDRRPDLHLHIAGSNMPEAIRSLASATTTVHGWVPSLRPVFEQVRVAIAPLRFGAGFKGKIPTYMAHGLPVVATSIALEGTGLQEDDGVLYADNPHDFAEAILRTHDNEAFWSDLSFRAVERCETLYSEATAREVFGGILRSLGLPSRR